MCTTILFNCTFQVLTWLNPTVNVSVGGNFVPAIAITSREMGTFTSLKNTVSNNSGGTLGYTARLYFFTFNY